MKNTIKLIYTLAMAVAMSATSCRQHDDDVPNVVVEKISKTELMSGWKITGNEVLWDLTRVGNTINNVYDLKSKVKNKITDKTSNHSLYFTDKIVYYLRYNDDDQENEDLPADDSLRYYIKMSVYELGGGDSTDEGYFITLENETLLGLYAPKIYIKKNTDGGLNLYLQKSEAIDMLNEEYSGTYYNTIKNNINELEVDIKTIKDSLGMYTTLDSIAQIYVNEYGL